MNATELSVLRLHCRLIVGHQVTTDIKYLTTSSHSYWHISPVVGAEYLSAVVPSCSLNK